MRATLKRISQAVATPRALERQALHELDDGRLVREHLSGDPQAFGTVVDRYQTRLLNFIYRTVGDRERAEDLVQEVFVRVYRHLHRFDQTKKFSTWIYTIASNLAKNELRNRSRNPLVFFQAIKKSWEAGERAGGADLPTRAPRGGGGGAPGGGGAGDPPGGGGGRAGEKKKGRG